MCLDLDVVESESASRFSINKLLVQHEIYKLD
jgi:hypothetical protein